jgi:hypothetical protein
MPCGWVHHSQRKFAACVSRTASVAQRSRIWLLSACMHNVNNNIMFLHFGLVRMRRPTLKKEQRAHQENGFWSRSHDLQLPACFACLRAPASPHTTIFIAIRTIRAQNYYTVPSLSKRRERNDAHAATKRTRATKTTNPISFSVSSRNIRSWNEKF